MERPRRFSRREFLAIGGGVAVVAFAGIQPRVSDAVVAPGENHTIYRLSVRGRRGSIAAKLHNANLRFATAAAADLHRAHPGDHSRIVAIVVNDETFQRLFPAAGILVADLRKVTLGCIGDCNHNGQVSEQEIVALVENALGRGQAPVCKKGDLNRDSKITVDEILDAVNNLQQTCS